MPTYEYVCKDCGEGLEVVQSFHDDALTVCPACSGSLRKVFSAAGIIFKGSGWHIKDYAPSSASGSSSGDGTSGSETSGSGSGADGSSSSSSDKASSDKASSGKTSSGKTSSDKTSSSTSSTGSSSSD